MTEDSNNINSSYAVIDLRSDTVSKPCNKMRQAMAEAAVGDDVYGEDPTVNQLEKQCAGIFSKEEGLFVPSGTMANLLSVMVHCSRRGTEAIVGDLSHVFLYEQGNAAHIAGVQLATIKNEDDGTFLLKDFERKIRCKDQHEPSTALVVVENTHNMCGGKIIPMKWIYELAAICRANNINMHMDGARVFNAAEALAISPAKIAEPFDSICFCLSKGLSAPVGSVLVGSKKFIQEARRLRKALGGGMRQAGILAAGGLFALEHVVPKLKDDHKNTLNIARAIHDLGSPSIKVDLPNVQTNILLLKILDSRITAADLSRRLATVTNLEIQNDICDKNGKGIIIKISARNWEFARIVLYPQISPDDVQLTIKKLKYVIEEIDTQLNNKV